MKNDDIKKIIVEMIQKMGISFDSIEEIFDEITNKNIFVIKTKESGLLIGENGDTFNALFMLIKRMVAKKSGNEEILSTFAIDVNDYHSSKVAKLKNQASIFANRAKDMKVNIEMEPMSSYERLVIHATLSDDPNIATESIGEGASRRIVIKYVKN
jgi:spoIIIJ-associated protein